MFYKNKKVLVTGGAGLIGTHLIEELLNRGAVVRATLHKKPSLVQDERIEYVQCDLTQRDDCYEVVKGMNYVFLCAANTSGAAVMARNPVAHVTINLLLNSQMFEAACLSKVNRLLFISSTTIYPPADYPVKETEAFVGDPYPSYMGVGWMKRYIEKLAQFYYQRYGFKVAVVRPTNVYGPYDKFDFETSQVLPALIRRSLEKQNPFEVWGDGSTVRDFVYATDLVTGILAAMEHCANCDPINIGSGQPVTIKEAVELILKLTGHTVPPTYDPSKPTTIPIRLVDLTKAQKLLNYQPKVDFETGLKQTINWYRQVTGL